MSDLQKEKEKLFRFKSTTEILEAAKTQTSASSEEYRDSIEPYFVARYFVAVFEARNGEIPIQVWNEYRNALDHLFRYLVNPTKEENQIKSAQKHFLRAALDVLKLHIHKTQDHVKALKIKYDYKVLLLVDNGTFIKEFESDFREAEKLFEQAKQNDLDLSDNHDKNSSVLKRYLDAAFASEKLRDRLDDSLEKIQYSQAQYNVINSDAHKHTFIEGIKIHVVSHFVTYLIIGFFSLLSLLYTTYQHLFNPLIQWIKSFLAA